MPRGRGSADGCGGEDAGLDASADATTGTDSGDTDGGPPGQPDFTISCGTPAEITQRGDLVRVTWTVGNVGTAAGDPMTVAVEMEQPAATAMDMDRFVELGSERSAVPIGLGGVAMGEVAFVAPAWTLGGANRLRCVVDSADEVSEADETNNSDGSLLIATGLPDLTPVNFRVTEGGGAPPINIDYFFVVRNDGLSAARSITWAFSPSDGAFRTVRGVVTYISAGGSIVVSGTVSGDMAIGYGALVDTDRTISESDETNNNAFLP